MEEIKVDTITERMRSERADDISLVEKAFEFARTAHEGQKRFSGEPYFTHAFQTALILAELGQDAETIAAGLLHDTMEDVPVPAQVIQREFGDQILFLVDGVTKLGKLKFLSRPGDQRIESLRKLFVAMAKDIRVLVIKLADRLHNVRTLEFVRPEKRTRIAMETLEMHARLAERFGMWRLKEELEDGAFKYAYPESWRRVNEMLEERHRMDEVRLVGIKGKLESALKERGLLSVEINHRMKAMYSTYKKLLEKQMDLAHIYDLSALRVVVHTIEDCYKVLGIVHGLWTPLPGRIKDYISTPKQNGYQSIHTDVFARDAIPVEIQIRTREMHQEAEFGIAAHIAYSEAGKPREGAKLNRKLHWVRQVLDWQRRVAESESSDFLENLKLDFFKYQIFVFTPKGDVIELPDGATAIDFAYSVHTSIGDTSAGAWVNGKYAGLDTILKNGDIVEINTRKDSKPSYSWLKFAKTTNARRKIKAGINLHGGVIPKHSG
ncbi:MAG: hypothetical protein COV07_00450 [Candidatus Vogelbacteria bacterium CG10_big_fil_rev_8_21_14_0_10_45_14]|uniref:(P)ppGpp synthetase n=1 Tax=Candidatus Vogelbacteria bacterium CG10_big_fil_rev_8_21_14_0_10_45_14 TaxID=1975042 RepID=A0A2H0RKQ5_9BACT|nr:MAG: hypothetical protein COV07_00450 [Candidatus Vogelbacteria bacterium CG10_big_fil_rev_8_21_14_0_10_45_14]